MKNTINLFFTAFFFFIVLIACENDKVASTLSENEITLNEKEFKITKASILGESVNNEGHSSIVLVSETSNNEPKTLTIDIPFFTKKSLTGSYEHPEASGKRPINSNATNYTYVLNSDPITANLESGTVTILHNGANNFSVTVDLKMENENIFKGKYSGSFTIKFDNQ